MDIILFCSYIVIGLFLGGMVVGNIDEPQDHNCTQIVVLMCLIWPLALIIVAGGLIGRKLAPLRWE